MNKLIAYLIVSLFCVQSSLWCMEQTDKTNSSSPMPIDQEEKKEAKNLSYVAEEENSLIKELQANANLTKPGTWNPQIWELTNERLSLEKMLERIRKLPLKRQWRIITSSPNVLNRAILNGNEEFVYKILQLIEKFEPEEQIIFVNQALENVKYSSFSGAYNRAINKQNFLKHQLRENKAIGKRMANEKEKAIEAQISQKEELGVSHYTRLLPEEIQERVSQYYRAGASKIYVDQLDEEKRLADGLEKASYSRSNFEKKVKQAFDEIAKLELERQVRVLSQGPFLKGELAYNDYEFKNLFMKFISKFDPQNELKILYSGAPYGSRNYHTKKRILELEGLKDILTDSDEEIAAKFHAAKNNFNIENLRNLVEELKNYPTDKLIAILLQK